MPVKADVDFGMLGLRVWVMVTTTRGWWPKCLVYGLQTIKGYIACLCSGSARLGFYAPAYGMSVKLPACFTYARLQYILYGPALPSGWTETLAPALINESSCLRCADLSAFRPRAGCSRWFGMASISPKSLFHSSLEPSRLSRNLPKAIICMLHYIYLPTHLPTG